jgi:hypothetical protein
MTHYGKDDPRMARMVNHLETFAPSAGAAQAVERVAGVRTVSPSFFHYHIRTVPSTPLLYTPAIPAHPAYVPFQNHPPIVHHQPAEYSVVSETNNGGYKIGVGASGGQGGSAPAGIEPGPAVAATLSPQQQQQIAAMYDDKPNTYNTVRGLSSINYLQFTFITFLFL